jgi:hypothetical protein
MSRGRGGPREGTMVLAGRLKTNLRCSHAKAMPKENAPSETPASSLTMPMTFKHSASVSRYTEWIRGRSSGKITCIRHGVPCYGSVTCPIIDENNHSPTRRRSLAHVAQHHACRHARIQDGVSVSTSLRNPLN